MINQKRNYNAAILQLFSKFDTYILNQEISSTETYASKQNFYRYFRFIRISCKNYKSLEHLHFPTITPPYLLSFHFQNVLLKDSNKPVLKTENNSWNLFEITKKFILFIVESVHIGIEYLVYFYLILFIFKVFKFPQGKSNI